MPDKPKLLSGGNPQIPKGYGEGPVRDYIAAMPDWKHAVGKRLDQLIVDAVPNVEKAVKWNTPFYGVEKDRWFTSFHCMTRYIKITFFDGADLDPPPPETSKYPQVRYLHIGATGAFDETQFTDWIKQAAKLPGERL